MEAPSICADRPIFGAGLANFPNVYPDYKLDRHVEFLLYPHNILLDFWVELGLTVQSGWCGLLADF